MPELGEASVMIAPDPGCVFAAVGSLHMIGAAGLSTLFAKRGYQIEFLPFSPRQLWLFNQCPRTSCQCNVTVALNSVAAGPMTPQGNWRENMGAEIMNCMRLGRAIWTALVAIACVYSAGALAQSPGCATRFTFCAGCEIGRAHV